MNFEEALKEIRKGKSVRCKGWENKNAFIYFVETLDTGDSSYKGFIAMKSAPGTDGYVVPWEQCQNDILRDDWEVVEKDEVMVRDRFGFGMALHYMRNGSKVARKGWNGKGMFVYYVPPGRYLARTAPAKSISDIEGKVSYGAYLALKTVTGEVVPWLASQTDILAMDWEKV